MLVLVDMGVTSTFFLVYNLAHKQLGIGIVDEIADAEPAALLSSDVTTWDWITTVMSLAVNIIATLLIVYKAWYISVSITNSLSHYNTCRTHHISARAVSPNRKTQVQAILLLFIESGAIFAVFQVG